MEIGGKVDRDDRTVRLIGEGGMKNMVNAKICLVNGTASGTETLKNLVLPGIGSFTVLDGGVVQESDLGTNFFVNSSHVGQSRAQCVTELLSELNPRTKGFAENRDPIALIDSEADLSKFFSNTNFTHVIASGLPIRQLSTLARHLLATRIPLFVVRAYGFIGSLRLVLPEHCVVETKPDNPPVDLRISAPFKELAEIAGASGIAIEGLWWDVSDEMDIFSLDSKDHRHVPYVTILVQALRKWRQSRMDEDAPSAVPKTRSEKDDFKSLIRAEQRSSDEENYTEAIEAAHHAWNQDDIPPEIQAILDDEKAIQPSADDDDFWIAAAALRRFVASEGEGHLPLQGDLPDMTCDTSAYLKLQHAYRTAADLQVGAVMDHARAILKAIGREEDSVSSSFVRLCCKNARVMRVLRFRSFEDEYDLSGSHPQNQELANQELATLLQDADSNAVWYILLQAADEFAVASGMGGRYPGSAHNPEGDVALLNDCAQEIMRNRKLKESIPLDAVHEFCRYGGYELHNTAAMIGGIASQEIMKVIVKQQIPLNNTLIVSGIKGITTVMTM